MITSFIAALSLLAAGTGLAQPVSGAGTAAAARIGDRTITLDDVDRLALVQDAAAFRGMRLRDAIYEARKAALDTLIGEQLIADEAKRRGVPADTLVARESAATMVPVTDADVEGWFKANQARLNGATFDKVAPRIRDGLEQQRREEARTRLVDRLRRAASVSVLLEPPRETITIGPGEPSHGSASAPVQLVVYSDYQCPYCARVEPALEQIKKTYGERVRIVFRDYPLTAIHPRAVDAAKAAHCANEQGRFWDYHRRLFAEQNRMADSDLLQHATELSLDTARFTACTSGARVAAIVRDNTASGDRLGVSATPAFFVNGRFMAGAQPFEAFQRVIDEELRAHATPR